MMAVMMIATMWTKAVADNFVSGFPQRQMKLKYMVGR